MYPLHLRAASGTDDRDLSRAAAEHHLMLQDFRLGPAPAPRRRGLGRLVAATRRLLAPALTAPPHLQTKGSR